ncbi:unnamed protein product [Closterium sp. NIES-54]
MTCCDPISGVAHKGYNPIRSRSCSMIVFFRAHHIALPCLSRRPALPVASPCPACRVALPCPRVALLAVAPPCPACESPCHARAEPPCCSNRPVAARPAACNPNGWRPAARAPPCWQRHRCPHYPASAALLLSALLCTALLADALLPARRPAARALPCWQPHRPVSRE